MWSFLVPPLFITVLSLAASVLFATIGRYTYTGIFGLVAIGGFLDTIWEARFWNVFQKKQTITQKLMKVSKLVKE